MPSSLITPGILFLTDKITFWSRFLYQYRVANSFSFSRRFLCIFAYPSGSPEITPSLAGFVCHSLKFSILRLCSIISLFVYFFYSHGVVSLFPIYEFQCPFGIFRPPFDVVLMFSRDVVRFILDLRFIMVSFVASPCCFLC